MSWTNSCSLTPALDDDSCRLRKIAVPIIDKPRQNHNSFMLSVEQSFGRRTSVEPGKDVYDFDAHRASAFRFLGFVSTPVLFVCSRRLFI